MFTRTHLYVERCDKCEIINTGRLRIRMRLIVASPSRLVLSLNEEKK